MFLNNRSNTIELRSTLTNIQKIKFYFSLCYAIHLHIRIQILKEICKRCLEKGYKIEK